MNLNKNKRNRSAKGSFGRYILDTLLPGHSEEVKRLSDSEAYSLGCNVLQKVSDAKKEKIKDSLSVEGLFHKYAAKEINPNFAKVEFKEVPAKGFVDYRFELSYPGEAHGAVGEHDEDPEADLWTITYPSGAQKQVHSAVNAVKYAIKAIKEVVPVSKDRFNIFKS